MVGGGLFLGTCPCVPPSGAGEGAVLAAVSLSLPAPPSDGFSACCSLSFPSQLTASLSISLVPFRLSFFCLCICLCLSLSPSFSLCISVCLSITVLCGPHCLSFSVLVTPQPPHSRSLQDPVSPSQTRQTSAWSLQAGWLWRSGSAPPALGWEPGPSATMTLQPACGSGIGGAVFP